MLSLLLFVVIIVVICERPHFRPKYSHLDVPIKYELGKTRSLRAIINFVSRNFSLSLLYSMYMFLSNCNVQRNTLFANFLDIGIAIKGISANDMEIIYMSEQLPFWA